MVSTVPAAKEQLIALLGGWPALTGVVVSWGSPTTPEDIQGEHIWLGNVIVDQDWHSLGGAQGRREERYDLEVVGRVIREGGDEKATEDRLWAIVGEVATALRSDPGLAGTLPSGFCQIRHVAQSTTPTLEPRAWVSRATLTVACTALI